tara:strand:+ start:1157 stop:2068 length:912 start_codon:yes stop_codon:yes gene_type:complete
MKSLLQKKLNTKNSVVLPEDLINKIHNYKLIELRDIKIKDVKIVFGYKDILREENNSISVAIVENINVKEFPNHLLKIYDKIKNGAYILFDSSKVRLHKIEISGLLMYRGFEMVGNLPKLDKKFILAKKSYEKSVIKSPSTKFLITLDRVGYKGKNIKIHKFRSMYKYSEFLHQGMLENSNLSNIGKIKGDPRITPLGRFMRKYWIDEIPQIYDLLTFKIKLVGIRAMSYAFFDQYPDTYKEKFYKVKPGLIGPIFDEKNTGFNQIVKIEEKYLDEYLKSPFMTDFKLFFKTLFMIFRGLRSS